jgi:hypothetical protein
LLHKATSMDGVNSINNMQIWNIERTWWKKTMQLTEDDFNITYLGRISLQKRQWIQVEKAVDKF